MTDQLIDPYRTYTFKVKVSGIDDAQFHFTKCSSISVSVDQQGNKNASNTLVTHQIPTQVQHDPITLSYGVTDSRALWSWLMKASEGKVERKTVSIFIKDSDGQSNKAHWELVGAWPQQWQSWDMDAGSGEIAIAQLTLVCEQIKQASS